MSSTVTVVILAAGKGTRMKSPRPKVLHRLAGRSMIGHVLSLAASLDTQRTVVVLAPDMAEVAAEVDRGPQPAAIAFQEPQLGTGHALMVARDHLRPTGDVLVLYGDTPLLLPTTLIRLLEARRAADAAVAVLGMHPPDPAGYGRLAFEDGELAAIVEDRHADDALRQDGLCNSGIMAFDAARLRTLLDALELRTPKNEYYLTDVVEHARGRRWGCIAVEIPWIEAIGVNSQAQLAEAEAVLQERLRQAAMAGGTTLIGPDTVFLAADTTLEEDVEVGPYVVFGPGVRVAQGARILSFCYLEGVTIGPGAQIGPFARFRPHSEVGAGAKVGNFVEVKNATLEAGAKANHLSYIGDAHVGAKANIGAGTITCNYDGFAKHRTDIGEGAFIGSNTALVAPVTIGDGAFVGAGSTISRDVPPGSLSIARGRQTDIADGAARLRARRTVKS
ncbi:MAG TPA: bifunctional UDP-N-acetylglucosamine diphosphorylase/glucosamine-1-phosphate N-acetyltransferase GlmU [Geminicoccaceae bacterium]